MLETLKPIGVIGISLLFIALAALVGPSPEGHLIMYMALYMISN